MILPKFAYHWSPSINRFGIHRDGLKPSNGGITDSRPTVCMSPTMQDAWNLSAALRDDTDWDLWHVEVPFDAFWRSDGYPEIRTFCRISTEFVTLLYSATYPEWADL